MKKILLSLMAMLFMCGMTNSAQTVSGNIGGYDYVDLGLTSGTKWAIHNVGATKSEEYGDYFAWGETKPKEVYDLSTYKWAGKTTQMTKYNSNDGYIKLLPEDDAATVNWGSDWRMPTADEQEELMNECYMVWTDNYNGGDVSGVVFYKAKSADDKGTYVAKGQNQKTDYNSDDIHLFFPCAAWYNGSETEFEGEFGQYWPSVRYEGFDGMTTQCLYFEGSETDMSLCIRHLGLPIRAVVNEEPKIESYVVSFYAKDSILIESQIVEKGKSATSVTAPSIEGFKFIGWSDSSFTSVTKDLDTYAQYKEIIMYSITVSGQKTGYDYVDLGLPNGTLWATYNVGATKPEECGDLFAWGETTTKETFSWDNYKWRNGDEEWLKYDPWDEEMSVGDCGNLEMEDDAAFVNWGESWRMPTYSEQVELLDGCDWEWVYDFNGTGMAGELGVSKTNANTIFLPASGYGLDDGITGRKGLAAYNSSSYEYASSWADAIILDVRNIAPYHKIYHSLNFRRDGSSIRAVVNNNSTGISSANNYALQVFATRGTIHIANAQPNTHIQVLEIDGKAVVSATTDAKGNAEITISDSKGVYVVTDGNQSTKVMLK